LLVGVAFGGGDPGGCGRTLGVGDGLRPDLVAVAVGPGGHGGLAAAAAAVAVHGHRLAAVTVGGAAALGGHVVVGGHAVADLPGGHRSGQLGLGAHPLVALQRSDVGRVLDAERVRG